LRKQDLTTMGGGRDPRRSVHVKADVTVSSDGGLTGVDSHPNANGPITERTLSILGRGHRVGRAGERNKECIALRVNLNTSVARECVAKRTAVLG
jgi:hypothetical protein